MSVYTNQTNANATTPFFVTAGGGGGGSNFPTGATFGTPGSAGTLIGISTINQTWNLTQSNVQWNAHDINFNPASNSQGGSVFQRITYNPDDAGQTALWLGCASPEGSVIWSIWDGYIWMPLTIRGAVIDFNSGDLNETFMRLDGNAGALGFISTGVPFLSASNALSSITAPGGDTANTTALFSTLKSLYPSNFS